VDLNTFDSVSIQAYLRHAFIGHFDNDNKTIYKQQVSKTPRAVTVAKGVNKTVMKTSVNTSAGINKAMPVAPFLHKPVQKLPTATSINSRNKNIYCIT